MSEVDQQSTLPASNLVSMLRDLASKCFDHGWITEQGWADRGADEIEQLQKMVDHLFDVHHCNCEFGVTHETAVKPARDAEHCDYPDCEQHWRAVVIQLRGALADARTYLPGRPGCPPSLLVRVDRALEMSADVPLTQETLPNDMDEYARVRSLSDEALIKEAACHSQMLVREMANRFDVVVEKLESSQETSDVYTQESLDAAHARTRERMAKLRIEPPLKASERPILEDHCEKHGPYRINAAGCPACLHSAQNGSEKP